MFNWSQFSDYAEVVEYKKDTVLFRQGDQLNGFYFLKKGKVMISVLREDGHERIIDFVFPGELIGEQLFNGNTSFTTATLLIDSELYYFSKEQFRKLNEQHPEASRAFSYSLIKKVRMLANMNSIKNAPIEIQLAHFLLNLHMKHGKNVIHLNQQHITKYIGKSRVALWKVLREWRLNNIVEISNQTIILKDIDKLRVCQ